MHEYKKRSEANIHARMHHLCMRHQSSNNAMAIAFIIIVARRITLPDLAMAKGVVRALFYLSGIVRAAFVARGLPKYLSSLGDYSSNFLARGLPEDLSSLGGCPTSFRRSGIAPGPFFTRGLPN
jgi:hypothetical protein